MTKEQLTRNKSKEVQKIINRFIYNWVLGRFSR